MLFFTLFVLCMFVTVGVCECSLIFWERRGHVVDPPAPISLQLDLVVFQQLQPLTKHVFVIRPGWTRAAEETERQKTAHLAFFGDFTLTALHATR